MNEPARAASTRAPAQKWAKAAELASGVGAIALGAGLGLLAPEVASAVAVPLLLVGILMHGAGMTLKHRLELAERAPQRWEVALFWLCLFSLAALLVWLPLRLLTI